MKFLADVNIDKAIVRGLRDSGHEVEWLAEDRSARRISDVSLMQRAYRQNAVILTNDREFVGYVFHDLMPAHGVVLFRLGATRLPRSDQIIRALDALNSYQSQLPAHFITIYPDHVEQEQISEDLPPSGQDIK